MKSNGRRTRLRPGKNYVKVGGRWAAVAPEKTPVGLWKMLNRSMATKATPPADSMVVHKLITPTHFYVVTYNRITVKWTAWYSVPYEMKDGKYVETVIATTRSIELIDKMIPYEYEYTGDNFSQKGILEFSDGDGTGGVIIQE